MKDKPVIAIAVGSVLVMVLTYLNLIGIVPLAYIAGGAVLLGFATILYLLFQVIFRSHHLK